MGTRTTRSTRSLTTSPEAAQAYAEGVDRLLRLRTGALESFGRALALDPTFAMAHAALALMGHEFCAPVDVAARLNAAKAHLRRSTEEEQAHVRAVIGHVAGDRTALVRHLRAYPGDALALSVAVPTIAFAGVTEVPADAWRLVEGCAPAYGDDWFYSGLLAFVRQEQGRWDEAMELANRSLEQAPDSGHAAHARAHVHYETGDHRDGLGWIDRWIRTDGSATDNLAHYSWHAALHELSVGDLDAVRRRYDAQLSPAQVHGPRSLVDTGSLVWRWSITPGPVDAPAMTEALDVDEDILLRPPTPFMGLHAAVALCAAEDISGLGRLGCWAAEHEDPVQRTVVARLARALRLLVLEQPSACADELAAIAPDVWRLGGSDAQREVVEETRVHALVRAGRYDEARAVIEQRLDRHRCRRDEWFLRAAAPAR